MFLKIPSPRIDLPLLVMRGRHQLIFLALAISAAFSMETAFLLRFEFSIPRVEMQHLFAAIAITLVVKLPVFYAFGVQRGWFLSTSIEDLKRILTTCLIGSCLFSLAAFLVYGNEFPRSVYVLDCVFSVSIVCALRVGIRIIREARIQNTGDPLKNILIYGAGAAGVALCREMSTNPQLRSRVVGFLDDNPNRVNESVLGIPVWAGRGNAARAVENLHERGVAVTEILIAIPSSTPEQMRAVIAGCRQTGLPCRILPAMTELLHDRHLRSQIRDIRLEDLLSREAITLEENAIRDSLYGKSVMVTGAAGSIGSELASHMAQFGPRQLILFDFAESQLYFIDQRLKSEGRSCQVCVIGDIRDINQLESAVVKYQVETIFHAAAYKHVPLMEDHALHAAVNNVLGTANAVGVAYRLGVKNFTLISTDKAVNPTSVMGATKRAAELVVSSYPNDRTIFSSVRFGNVLGSNGSVVPLFQSQIARGGPVTVTHPDVTRYFMTVREAVQLVLQASTMARGGEVFVLDMGQPVRIADLAHNLIRLAGLTPEIDIEITYSGLRPGEKLYEELIAHGEAILPTHHEKVKIFKGPRPDRCGVTHWLTELSKITARQESAQIVHHLASLIPEYRPSRQWANQEEFSGPPAFGSAPPRAAIGAANV